MKKIIIKNYKSPYGELIVGSYDEKLCLCDWRFRKMRPVIDKRIQLELIAEFEEGYSEVADLTILQLEEYFAGERKEFNIPIQLAGTEFQLKVWNEIMKIPFGKTESYLSLSGKLHKEKAIRAVASANGANSIAIIVPCHRVIGSKGELTGYAGGLNIKKRLLQLENCVVEQLELF
jgi:methylated-DNA-[protein]-cysteine S-methyltransferase